MSAHISLIGAHGHAGDIPRKAMKATLIQIPKEKPK